MTNPFEAFDISDDEEGFVKPAGEQKVKRTHQEKRIYKQQQEAVKSTPAPTQVVETEPLPDRVKEDAKRTRNTRAPPTPQTKQLGEGHFLDRRSGTGRVDRPRKEGGGKGNIGNIKDDLNQDKYIKETEGEQTPAVEAVAEEAQEAKPEEPKTFTLEEYYKNKGVELNNVYQQKSTKKGEVNAEWIKKEKLVVLESKEDKKNSERNTQNVVKFSSGRAGLDENLEGLGFGQKTAPRRQEERRDQKPDFKGKGNKKPIVNVEDFPAL